VRRNRVDRPRRELAICGASFFDMEEGRGHGRGIHPEPDGEDPVPSRQNAARSSRMISDTMGSKRIQPTGRRPTPSHTSNFLSHRRVSPWARKIRTSCADLSDHTSTRTLLNGGFMESASSDPYAMSPHSNHCTGLAERMPSITSLSARHSPPNAYAGRQGGATRLSTSRP